MLSIGRWSLSSLIYLFAVSVMVQMFMHLNTHANPTRAVEFVFLVPGLIIFVWKMWKCISGTVYDRAPAVIAAIFWGVVPIYMVGLTDRLGHIIGDGGVMISISCGVTLILIDWGPRIFPWLGMAMIIHTGTFYLCLVKPTIVNPIIASAAGAVAIFALVGFSRAIDPALSMSPRIGKPRPVP